MTDNEGGLNPRAVAWLGFDAPCKCGHEDGFHDRHGRCVVLGCGCKKFEHAEADNETSVG